MTLSGQQVEENENRADVALEMAWQAQEMGVPLGENLSVGYDSQEALWTVIVRTVGNLEEWRERGLLVTELYGGYGILRLPLSEVDWVLKQPQLVFMEKPFRMNYAGTGRPLMACLLEGRQAICMGALQTGADALTGNGVLVAVLDSGIDVSHPDFKQDDGRSRILYYWDQAASGVPPEGFTRGAEYSAVDIDANPNLGVRTGLGHGTGVLGIAAGNGRASGGRYRGIAYESDILAVNLASAEEGGFPRTTELMEAVEYVMRKAEELVRPLVINISFGNNYGSHEGDTLLETYLNERQGAWRSLIVIGSGNEAESGGHAQGQFVRSPSTQSEILQQVQEVELAVGEGERNFSVQLWKSNGDDFLVELVQPTGRVLGRLENEREFREWRVGNTRVLAYAGGPVPYRRSQEFLWEWSAVTENGEGVPSGIWKFRLIPKRIVQGRYDLYLSGSETRGVRTRFLRPEPDTTLTIPSAASAPLSVGAWNVASRQPAPFSGRGYTRLANAVKPDLAAPGVDITAAAPGGGYQSWTGTSFATPFVTGAAALLMEWGIVRGNDPLGYGETLKSRLIRGAEQLRGLPTPNVMTGWGTLCIRDSLPG